MNGWRSSATRAQASVRYAQSLEALGRRLAGGRTMQHEIAEDVLALRGETRPEEP